MKLEKKDYLNFFTLIFLLCSFLGTFYEEIYFLLAFYKDNGYFYYATRSGLIYGPFCPIYGVGCVFAIILFGLKEKSWLEAFLYGSLVGGAFEYLASFLEEKLLGKISWNYADKFLNINGRTTIPIALLWGLLVGLFIKLVYPLLLKLYLKIKNKYTNILFKLLFVFVIFDLSVSCIAMYRMSQRELGKEPVTFIGMLCDKHYPDDRLNKIYNNARKVN